MIGTLRDSLENLYPDSQVEGLRGDGLRIGAARGSTLAVHVLLTGLPDGAAVRPALKDARGRTQKAEWFRLLDVPVEVNTGLGAFVEKEGEPNPHVIRRAPFRTYDAMEPVGASVKSASATMVLRVHLPVPADARPGEHEFVVRIACDREEADFPFTAQIHVPVVPAVGAHSFPYTNWFSYDAIAKRHGLKPWSEAHWRMLRRYADLMARARQNTFWIPLASVFTVRRGQPLLDAVRLRRIVKTFTDAGLYWIEGGHFGGRTTDEWTCPTFSVSLVSQLAASPEGNEAIAAIGRQLMTEIGRNGWRDRWLQHVADEPIHANADSYRIFVGIVRKYMPGIPILDATMHEFLVGSVDIWCPQVQECEKHRDHFDRQKRLGDKVRFYTCCSPGGPWLNRLLDQELLRPALFGWAAALYGLDGFLHWGFNHYRENQDPFQQSVVEHGGGNRLPAGDTHVVYPGKEGPWSSLRLEAQREGFEDYELLRILRARARKRAEHIIRRVIRRADEYTRDVNVFRAARQALLTTR